MVAAVCDGQGEQHHSAPIPRVHPAPDVSCPSEQRSAHDLPGHMALPARVQGYLAETIRVLMRSSGLESHGENLAGLASTHGAGLKLIEGTRDGNRQAEGCRTGGRCARILLQCTPVPDWPSVAILTSDAHPYLTP